MFARLHQIRTNPWREDHLRILLAIAVFGFALVISPSSARAAPARPNVLMIFIDDLNDWIGCLGGHPQTQTPHLDALAARGILFTNAHCNAPLCNPSRVSFLTGVRPSTSGIYLNNQALRSPNSLIKDAVTLPQHFAAQGYDTLGCGKIFHGGKEKENFQVYGPAGGFGPFPPQKLSCPKEASQANFWDWGVYPTGSEDEFHDVINSRWAAERLSETRDKPFLLGCGFYRPHAPFFAPQRFFDLHPLEDVQLPPVLDDDRDDIPSVAFTVATNPVPPSHDWIVQSGEWRHAVQSYLASVSFLDENVGRLISALDASPHADNTWIVLFSDHGFFLGEKQRWAKQAVWERATRVPLIIVPPKDDPRWQAAVGTRCSRPVELLSVYPTLVDVCGLKPPADQLEGPSLVPLLTGHFDVWPHLAVTTYNGDNHGVRDDRYRYIRYYDGSEELYDLQNDPQEWHNLAGDERLRPIRERLAKFVPKQVVHTPDSH